MHNNNEPVKSLNGTHVCHSSESANPLFQMLTSIWVPTFAGMTTIYECINNNGCPSVSVFEGCELLAIYYLFYACYLVLLPFKFVFFNPLVMIFER